MIEFAIVMFSVMLLQSLSGGALLADVRARLVCEIS